MSDRTQKRVGHGGRKRSGEWEKRNKKRRNGDVIFPY